MKETSSGPYVWVLQTELNLMLSYSLIGPFQDF